MNNRALQLTLKSYQQQVESHEHDFHQLVLPVSGVLELDVGHHSGQVDQQHVAVIAAGKEHAFEGRLENRFIVADVPRVLAPGLDKLPAFLEVDRSIVQYIRFLHGELSAGSGADNQLMQRQMLLLLVQLIDQRFGVQLPVDRRVEVARNYLEQHYSQEINSATLAAAANLSPRHLRQLFQRCYGLSPSQYLLELRMQAAWSLLKSSSISVQRVAEQVGYQSLSSFSDRFSKHFGSSPLQFRRLDK